MKTNRYVDCVTIILCGILFIAPAARGQLASVTDGIIARYKERLALAEKNRDAGVARAQLSFESEKKLAQEEVKRAFESPIRSAAFRNQTDDVRKLTAQLDAIIDPEHASRTSEGDSLPNGTDYKSLVGTWISSNVNGSNSVQTFEFKSNRSVTYTSTYNGQGNKNTNTQEFRATVKKDKIVIEQKQTYAYSTYKHWYEIMLPFDSNKLSIVRRYESNGSNRSNTIELTKKTP